MDQINDAMTNHLDQLNKKRVDLKQKDEQLKGKIGFKQTELKTIEDQLMILQTRLQEVTSKFESYNDIPLTSSVSQPNCNTSI